MGKVKSEGDQGGTLCRWDVPSTDIPGTVYNRFLPDVKDWMRCKPVKVTIVKDLPIHV